MAIIKGHPIVWQDIVDAVTANYPEYIPFFLPTTFTNDPLVLDPAPFGGTDNPDAAIFIAMICPPNMAVRPATIAGFNLDTPAPTGVTPELGYDFSTFIRVKKPIVAPDVFQDFTSAVYGPGTDDSITDVLTQIAAYRTANPLVVVAGTLVAHYTQVIGPDTFGMAIAKLCGKDMS